MLPCNLRLDGGMDLSGKFVASSGQKNRIPVRKSNLVIIRFWNYNARTVRQVLLHHKNDTEKNHSGFKGTQVQYCCIQANHTSKCLRTVKFPDGSRPRNVTEAQDNCNRYSRCRIEQKAVATMNMAPG